MKNRVQRRDPSGMFPSGPPAGGGGSGLPRAPGGRFPDWPDVAQPASAVAAGEARAGVWWRAELGELGGG